MVTQGLKGGLTLVGLLLLVALAYYGGRAWQSSQAAYTRIAPTPACDLRAGPCRQAVAGGHISLAITPHEIPLMQPLRLVLETKGLTVRGVEVEIRGLNMDMGLNRTVLVQTADGHWEGETILPVCSQRTMEWEAAVRLDSAGRVEVPFVFHTTRP